ncbi:MAG: hypothetical protein Phyf2KO_07800 [Phycisphaerales bacterium]
MNLLPAILLAVPIATILIMVRILIVLQNRKHAPGKHDNADTVTIATEPKPTQSNSN